MIIGYARVSTIDQSEALQIEALSNAGCEKIFTDKSSGTKSKRPELDKCLDMMRSGDTLIVWRLDRLARSTRHLIDLSAQFNALGVSFKSLHENIDTTTANGRLIFHIFSSLAEFESSLISERTKAGMLAARARGRSGGRKPKMSLSDAKKARAMLEDETITYKEVQEHFGVTWQTLKRHLKILNDSEKGSPA